MPYKYKFNGKKVYKRLFGQKKLNKRQKKEVKTIMNKELETKSADFFSGIGAQYGSTTSSTTYQDISLLAQGVTSTTRVGDQVRPLLMKCRYLFDQQTTAQGETRVIIFQWRPDNAVAPTVGDILDAGPGGGASVFSHINFDNRHLFKILKDYSFCSNPSIANPNNLHVVNWDINLSKIPKINYDIGANTGDHHIYQLILSSATLGATGPLVTFDCRIFYKDA